MFKSSYRKALGEILRGVKFVKQQESDKKSAQQDKFTNSHGQKNISQCDNNNMTSCAGHENRSRKRKKCDCKRM